MLLSSIGHTYSCFSFRFLSIIFVILCDFRVLLLGLMCPINLAELAFPLIFP